MGPQHVPAWPAVPGGDVAPANRGPRTRALPIEDKEIVGAGFHAEFWCPAIADRGKFDLEPPADEFHTWHQDPQAIALQQALRDTWRCALVAEGGGRQLRSCGLGTHRNQSHGVHRYPEGM